MLGQLLCPDFASRLMDNQVSSLFAPDSIWAMRGRGKESLIPSRASAMTLLPRDPTGWSNSCEGDPGILITTHYAAWKHPTIYTVHRTIKNGYIAAWSSK